jgi:chromatin remodeling complex protein RSC6
MPRISKQSVQSKTVEVPSSNILEEVSPIQLSESTPITKTPRVKKAKKESTPSDLTLIQKEIPTNIVSEAPEVPDVLDENLVLETVSPTMIEQTTDFLAKLQQASSLISALKTDFRVLEKKWSRDLKNAQKKGGRRRASGQTTNRSPSGFVKPTRISDELASFLGKEIGTEMARTAVTRDINAYIRANSLQDTDNGRKINPDTKLATLLKLTSADELTYFNLQRYMSPHFHKNVKVEEAVSAPVV